VMLGVLADNVVASRLYHRLGFTGLHRLTAFTLR
jgi:predicted GNAT family acetyltransferase